MSVYVTMKLSKGLMDTAKPALLTYPIVGPAQ
ncbi:PHIKZ117.2 [Pseudomonas phage phiKZ]|uniref:PHIKZ117.2 n=1 Tax=Pseudomonas phage phiKZ TaxID=2905945 RepID=L7T499_BPDPK|nr:PHIKZ117.2 [Pseudomonas phage phiKZ]AGC26332.1 PHIKZ117.2 [Pseudomonas phage phiKZ]